MENNGWRLFFNSFAPYYMQESFTRNTRYEVDFIEEEFNLPKHSYIVDIGCGTGRHSIEMAKRGYNVTGVDISESMLKEAEKSTLREGVDVQFVCADATEFKADRLYNACIWL